MNPPIQSPVPPDLRALLDIFKSELRYDLNCHQVGQIISFDASKQTASVQISVLKTLPDGKQVPYPVLGDCPVAILSGGTAYLQMPIQSGDPCLVLFNDRDIDNWFTTGNVVAPNTERAHDLSDGLVIVGVRNLGNKLAGYLLTGAALVNNGARVTVLNTGAIQITGKEGGTVTVDTSGNLSLEAEDGASLTLDDKVALDSASGSLSSVLSALMTALTALNGKTGPSAATQIAALQIQVDNLV